MGYRIDEYKASVLICGDVVNVPHVQSVLPYAGVVTVSNFTTESPTFGLPILLR